MDSMTGHEILVLSIQKSNLMMEQKKELGAQIVAHEEQRATMKAEHDKQHVMLKAEALRLAEVYAAKLNASQLEEMRDARLG